MLEIFIGWKIATPFTTEFLFCTAIAWVGFVTMLHEQIQNFESDALGSQVAIESLKP